MTIELNHTLNEWNALKKTNPDLWDFKETELLDGTVTPRDDITYWYINGRLYETPLELGTFAVDYWTQYVIDMCDCRGYAIDRNDAKKIANKLLNNDDLWSDIDYHAINTIDEELQERLNYLEKKGAVCPLDQDEIYEIEALKNVLR